MGGNYSNEAYPKKAYTFNKKDAIQGKRSELNAFGA